MAKSTPWAERTGSERRRTFGGFAALYGAIALIALAVGWLLVGAFFGIVALALAIAWRVTDPSTSPSTRVEQRTKPDWLLAMDDPDAPDLSRPEYNTKRRADPAVDGRSDLDRPGAPRESHPADRDVGETAPSDDPPQSSPPPGAPPSPGT